MIHALNPGLVMLENQRLRADRALARAAWPGPGGAGLLGRVVPHRAARRASGPLRGGVRGLHHGAVGHLGVMLALYHRRASGGEGQVIDQALYESVLPMLCEVPMMYRRYGEIITRNGNRVHGIAPGDAFESADAAWVQISASGEPAWQHLTEAMGRSDLLDDSRFATSQ